MKPLSKRVAAYKARMNFGELLNEVFYRGATVVITRRGKTMAVVTPPHPSPPRRKRIATDWRRTVEGLAGSLKGKDGAIIARIVRESRRELPSPPVNLDA